jgi:hypothetical protein
VEEKEKTVNQTVAIEVKTQNFDAKGQLTDIIKAASKLTKADDGRINNTDDDSLTLSASNCGTTKVEVGYNSSSIGEGEKETILEVDVKAQKLDATKKELIDSLASSAKLTKADAGRNKTEKTEDWFNLNVEASETGCAKTESYYRTKVSAITFEQ